MRCMLILLECLMLSVLASAQNLNSFTVNNLLQSNMVIQQQKPFKISGTANAGDKILIKASWANKAITAFADNNGHWLTIIKVPAAKAGDYTAYSIVIKHNNDSIILDNILIGEVWLCSGQSNMDMTLQPFLPWLRGVVDYEKEITAADYPFIRVLDIATDFKNQPVEKTKAEWKICTPANAGEFSAVAYYFAVELFNTLQVPVGLVTSAVGGSGCQAWTSRQTLTTDELLYKKYVYSFDTSIYAKEIPDTVITFEKVLRPAVFYNSMIYPLQNISLRGFLWYQGESNKDDREMYTRLSIAMIENWRQLFKQGELPFYYVQIAPYNLMRSDSTEFDYAIFREAQEAILKEKNTGMALTMDIGEPGDIHPRNKKDVGKRLVLIALAKTYNMPGIVYKGPQFSGFTVSGNTVTVSFEKETIAGGLSTSDNNYPKHFFVAGDDKIFYTADAAIVNNTIVLHSEKVQRPVAVRYAFTNYPLTNFCNKDGLPAMPFRTDKWDVIPSSKTLVQ